MKKTLLLCGLALASLASTPAFADTFSFTFSGPVFSGSGYFDATEVGSTDFYNITNVYNGSVTAIGLGTSSITGIVKAGKFDGNDNILIYPATGLFGDQYFDSNGVAFSLANGNDVDLSANWLFESALGGSPRGDDVYELDCVDVTLSGQSGQSDPPAATPEPSSLALLGTSILGAAGVLRRRFAA
jgi:PEP-CTERM motif